MNRFLLAGLAGLGLAGLVLASGGDAGPRPSAVAVANGYPPGPYSEATFEISDDAAVMVLRVDHDGRSMRLYGDGRLNIQTGDDERYSRRLDRSRMLEIFRTAVDHGLAEFGPDLLILEIGEDAAFRKPCKTPRVEATLRFTAYDRHGAGANQSTRGICPADYPGIVQSQALADLAAVLEVELSAARREGSIEIPAANYESAKFTLSSDPTELIFSFGRLYGLSTTRSMRLYGDGRLELRNIEQGNVTRESFDRILDYPDMVELVRIAVDHGFAEWDHDTLRWRSRTDAGGAGGEIHLETYQRGEYTRNNLTRKYQLPDVGLALERYPERIQVQGLKAILQALDDQFEAARGEVKK